MLRRLLQSGHTKVCNLDISTAGEKNILRLEISMTNIKLVAVSNSAQKLSKILQRLFLRQKSRAADVIKKLAIINIF
jgi:hypothetical protein